MPNIYDEYTIAGKQVSSTYEGRHITFAEGWLIHPDNTDADLNDYVNAKDPVLIGENIVGVAFNDASSIWERIAIDTEGIWALACDAIDEGGDSDIDVGDELYIHKTTAVISKIRNPATHARYGYALTELDGGTLQGTVVVKVHWDPDVELNDVIWAKEAQFIEDGAAGVYTASINLPAGATLVDIIVHAVALWDAGTSATMIVGDVADPDGFFIGVNLKGTDLTAGQSISFAHTGGKQGADLDIPAADAHVRRRYLAGARVISGVVTTVGTAGSAGRTRMTVYYSVPSTVVTATKV